MILETIYHSTLFYATTQQENLDTFEIFLSVALSILLIFLIVMDIIKLILFPTTFTNNLRKKYSVCHFLFSQKLYQHEIWWVRRVFRIILFISIIFVKKMFILVIIFGLSWVIVYFFCVALDFIKAIFYVNSIFHFLVVLTGIILLILIILFFAEMTFKIITDPPPKVINFKLR